MGVIVVGVDSRRGEGGAPLRASRRDALRLMERLIRFHSFLVQHTTEHWVVHARAPAATASRSPTRSA